MLMLAGSLFVAAVAAADPCALVTRAEAAALAGHAISSAIASGPEVDPDTKASVAACLMGGGPVAVLVTVETYASAAAALRVVTAGYVKEQIDDETAKVEVEPAGVGDRAFWAYTDNGARIVTVRGATAVIVALAGPDFKNAASTRQALRAAAVRALSRL